MSLTPGEIVDGKYRIVRTLGQGGMGAVYQGENVRIRRRVAIKVLHASVSSQAESVARFEREAQAAARIGSEHICEVLDLGVLPDGTRYMVMEYLEGETLGARIKRAGRMPPDQSIPVMGQILDALGAAHTAGIIHRDLKPDNIFLLHTKSGIADFVKILDFGVSKFSVLSGEEMNMTRTGAVVGTPYYMSPEQARGMHVVDHRSDIYALGVLLYQATTGQVPFQATTFNELLFKIVLEPAPPPQHYVPDLDVDFSALIQKAMAREPQHRFQSCGEFKSALLGWLSVHPELVPGLGGVRPGFPRQVKTQVLEGMPQAMMMTPSQPLSPSGSAWPAAHISSPGLSTSNPGLQAQLPPGQQPLTANSWGDSSGMTRQPPKPASRAPLVAVMVAGVALLGGGAAAWMMFGRRAPEPPPTVAAADPPPAPPETAPEPPVPAAPPAETAEAPVEKPAETAAPATPTAPTTVAVAPTTPPAVQRPIVRQPPRPPATTAPTTKPGTKPGGVPGDFGY